MIRAGTAERVCDKRVPTVKQFFRLTRDSTVAYDSRMDLEPLRTAIAKRRGQWYRIADAAGLNRKTVERIMADPGYNPTLSTINALWHGVKSTPRRPSKAS